MTGISSSSSVLSRWTTSVVFQVPWFTEHRDWIMGNRLISISRCLYCSSVAVLLIYSRIESEWNWFISVLINLCILNVNKILRQARMFRLNYSNMNSFKNNIVSFKSIDFSSDIDRLTNDSDFRDRFRILKSFFFEFQPWS